MTEHKEAAAVRRLHDIEAHLVGHSYDLQVRNGLHVLRAHLGVAGVHGIKAVVQTAHQRAFRLDQAVLKHAGSLARQAVLRDTVVIVEASLRAPADMQGGVHVCARPVHDAAELVPVVNVFKFQQLNRGAGNNQTVKMLVLDVLERAIEGLQMAGRDMRSLVALGAQQVDLDLQRRVGKLAHDLRLGSHLGGHEVQDEHTQGTNVLVKGAELRHHKDVLALEDFGRGQRIGDSDRHDGYSFASLQWRLLYPAAGYASHGQRLAE